jgi:hypothetical protein
VYDRANPSRAKFPPHLHNTWIGFDFKQSRMHLFGLDTVTLGVTSKLRLDDGLMKGIPLRNPVGGHYGPDGALYILNYDGSYSAFNPGIARVEYTGTCRQEPGAVRRSQDGWSRFNISLSPMALEVRESGAHVFELYGARGARLSRMTGKQGARYEFAALRRERGLVPGVYLARVETAAGIFLRKVSLL